MVLGQTRLGFATAATHWANPCTITHHVEHVPDLPRPTRSGRPFLWSGVHKESVRLRGAEVHGCHALARRSGSAPPGRAGHLTASIWHQNRLLTELGRSPSFLQRTLKLHPLPRW